MRRAILVLMTLEVAGFGTAAALHLGFMVLGRVESRVPSEAAVQGTVGLLIAVSAWAIWRRKIWARKAALAAHLLGFAGALFGLAVALGENARVCLDLYDLTRLTVLVAVPVVLSTPSARREFEAGSS